MQISHLCLAKQHSAIMENLSGGQTEYIINNEFNISQNHSCCLNTVSGEFLEVSHTSCIAYFEYYGFIESYRKNQIGTLDHVVPYSASILALSIY